MASPQKENGYTSIANELFDALISYRIPGEERMCLDFIIRKTYGYHKTEDTISNSQFVKATGLRRQNVNRAINRLVEKNLVIKKDYKKIPTYRFNKNYKQWEVSSKKITVIKNDSACNQKRLQSVIKNEAHKRKKETIQKKEDDFLIFYSAYPKKKSKQAALKAWIKISPDLQTCLNAIEKQKKEKELEKKEKGWTADWKHPATWINGQCWEDETSGECVEEYNPTITTAADIERKLYG